MLRRRAALCPLLRGARLCKLQRMRGLIVPALLLVGCASKEVRTPAPSESPVVKSAPAPSASGAAAEPAPVKGSEAGVLSLSQVQLPTGSFKHLSLGSRGLCAVRDPDGSIVCVGFGEAEQAAELPRGPFVEVAGDGAAGCAIDAARKLRCWGAVSELETLVKGRAIQKVVLRSDDGCALLSGAELVCAGELAKDAPKQALDVDTQSSSGACAVLQSHEPFCWSYHKTKLSGPLEKIAVAGWGDCGIDRQGNIACTGTNAQIAAQRFDELRGGFNHFCGTENGKLRCVGLGDFGETLVPNAAVRAFDVKGRRTCWIGLDGALACAGEGFFVGPQASGVREITVVEECGCTLGTNGAVHCFGNRCGLPDGVLEGTFKSVSADKDSGCALGLDGRASCWGADLASVPQEKLASIDVGLAIACYRREADGSVGCFTDVDFRRKPELLTPPRGRFDSVEIGVTWACGLRPNGAAECWGYKDYSDDQYELTPVPKGQRFNRLSVGYNHICAITKDARDAVCWGRDRFGETKPQKGPFIAIDAGEVKSCAVRESGELLCWGREDAPRSLPQGRFVRVAVEKYNDERKAAIVCGVREGGEVACGRY